MRKKAFDDACYNPAFWSLLLTMPLPRIRSLLDGLKKSSESEEYTSTEYLVDSLSKHALRHLNLCKLVLIVWSCIVIILILISPSVLGNTKAIDKSLFSMSASPSRSTAERDKVCDLNYFLSFFNWRFLGAQARWWKMCSHCLNKSAIMSCISICGCTCGKSRRRLIGQSGILLPQAADREITQDFAK